MPKVKRAPRQQYGAIPYRVGPQGDLEVLLVTTRETRRWMVPKGWPMKNRLPVEAAMREAYEEAGVEGAGGERIGSFEYLKVLRSGPNQRCCVDLFPLRVENVFEDWPERYQRERRWFSLAEAAQVVTEDELRILLQQFPVRVGVASQSSRAEKA